MCCQKTLYHNIEKIFYAIELYQKGCSFDTISKETGLPKSFLKKIFLPKKKDAFYTFWTGCERKY